MLFLFFPPIMLIMLVFLSILYWCIIEMILMKLNVPAITLIVPGIFVWVYWLLWLAGYYQKLLGV